MVRIAAVILACVLALESGQNPQPPSQSSTRPPANNDETLRPLTPEEIPPNLNFYAIDPLYTPGVPLGWAEKRIEETLDRGLQATVVEGGQVYLSWRLLGGDAEAVAFNVYRSTAGATPVRINAAPILRTTDLVDVRPPLDRETAWWVKAVVADREQEERARVTLPANPPVRQYSAIRLKEDIRSVDRIAIADLNGDGTYDFVVKHPSGVVDPGRVRPSPDT